MVVAGGSAVTAAVGWTRPQSLENQVVDSLMGNSEKANEEEHISRLQAEYERQGRINKWLKRALEEGATLVSLPNVNELPSVFAEYRHDLKGVGNLQRGIEKLQVQNFSLYQQVAPDFQERLNQVEAEEKKHNVALLLSALGNMK